jgi:hypothetical protein
MLRDHGGAGGRTGTRAGWWDRLRSAGIGTYELPSGLRQSTSRRPRDAATIRARGPACDGRSTPARGCPDRWCRLLSTRRLVCLREPARPAAREPALDVSVAELAHHGRRRIPRQPSESNRFAVSVLQHRSAPARHRAGGVRSPGGSIHHPRPRLRPRFRPGRRAERERRRSHDPGRRRSRSDWSTRQPARRLGVLGRRRGHPRPASGGSSHSSLERAGHDRSLGRGQFRLEAEAVPVVQPPPVEEPSVLGVANVLDRSAHLQIRPPSNGRGRTYLAHETKPASDSKVANRASSTTLSMPSSPEERARARSVRCSSAWPAAIHRRAFH